MTETKSVNIPIDFLSQLTEGKHSIVGIDLEPTADMLVSIWKNFEGQKMTPVRMRYYKKDREQFESQYPKELFKWYVVGCLMVKFGG